MKSKKTVFEKQIIRKKMVSLIIYGIIFLISTIAFYFVNNSKAKNILKIGVSIIDKEANVEICNYDLKVQEEDGKYKTKLLPIQGGFKVKKYKLASKSEFDEYKKIYEEKNKPKDEKKDKEEKQKDKDSKNEKEIKDEDEQKLDVEIQENKDNEKENKKIETENEEQENNTVEKKTEDKEKEIHTLIGDEKEEKEGREEKAELVQNSKEIELTDEQIQEKQIYIFAEYDNKEVKNNTIYNKVISNSTEQANISVSGYMPENAELSVKNEDTKEVKEKILKNFQDVNKEINLVAAYDIKILSEDKEYEPEDFDETATVSIQGIDGKKFKIWHIKNDNTVELIEPKSESEIIEFETEGFSIYGIELEEEIKEKDEKNIDSEETVIVTKESNSTNEENTTDENNSEEINNMTDGNNTAPEQSVQDNKKQKTILKRAPRKAAARNLENSTLTIDDYQSDYYYYMGKNYTDNISGTNTNTYSSENLVKVTLNYHGFAQGETDNEKKGWISLDSGEGQNIVKNIRCAQVKNGSITLELMENPFMDKPTGYGFGGWTASKGTVSKNSKTLTYSLTVSTSSDITVDLYAKWEEATVVYVNPTTGSDNSNDGLTEETPFGSWGKAFEYINSHNKNDREKNIIVLTGNIDSSINYTRPVTTSVTKPVKSITYNSSTSINQGTTYLLATDQGIGANAITASGTGVTNTQLTDTSAPPEDAGWILTSSYYGYYIQNASTGQYLTCNDDGTLSMSSSRTEWRYSDRKFYYYGDYYDFYLRYNNGWTTSTRSRNGTQFYFVTYNAVYDEEAEDVVTRRKGGFSRNSYYTSSSDSIPVTVTSLYNHTDYRANAKIDLSNSSYNNFSIYKAFQMNHVSVDAEGYTSNNDGTTYDTDYPWLIGYLNNVRLGRGIQSVNSESDACTFANVIGGEATSETSSDEYKLIVESGKYSSVQGFNRSGQTNSYYGIVYLTLGNDIDRISNNNNKLSVYYRTTINSGGGLNGTSSNDKAWLINVKSGKFGTDYFDTYGEDEEDSAYSGIYMGGYGTSEGRNTRDRSDRYMIVEGGLIANAIGGLKVTNNSGVETRLYVKGGEIYNIVGGAGVSTTYEDRIIQVTGGTVRYSVNGGSNGVHASGYGQDGRITNCDTLVYIGGNAQIGKTDTLSKTLYGVEAGCVLGAGNGNSRVTNSGQVDTTHLIINDEAHILNSVYGGGNYGIVGTSGRTTGTTKIEILGGTIDKNVYGGANQNNIYGSTTINMKDGQVKGAIYGGSNTSGTISTTTTIEVTGGTLGKDTNTTDNEVLFGGGYGSNTTVTGNAIINIKDTDGDVKIYGSAYGGSSQGRMSSNVTVNIQDIPSTENKISIKGNVFAGGKGTSSISATINGNATINVDGSNLPEASVFGGNDINGVTNGNITVNIGKTYESKLLNAYGGGNKDATGTEADTVKVYLFTHANVTNAFNGGRSADLTTGGNSDTTRAIYLQGGNAENIFGGSDTEGTVTASHVYIESGTATNVYGGNNQGGQTSESFVYIQGGTVENVYGGGYKATTPTTNVSLTAGTITNGFGGGNAANVTTSNITLNGTVATNIYGGSNSSGTVTESNVLISSGRVANVYGGNNAGGNTVDTNVTVNSKATNVYGGGDKAQTTGNTNVLINSEVTNVYGGGNEARTSGNTYVRLTNATVTGDAYGGGNGSAAVVVGNSTTLVEGTTSIAGDLFGGGNAAANGTSSSHNSVVTTYITGGNITGDVYGAANTSVVNGNTVVKIGSSAVNDSTMAQGNIHIGGTVFGGGKSNTAGSETYDFTFESVTGDANIDIDATGYDNGTYTFNIDKSVFGSGNAAKISGYGIVNIKNYGSASNIKENVSIQRASRVTLDNCHIFLEGTNDTTNEIASATYTFNRIDDLILKNNTRLYLASGVNIVSKMQSLDSTGNKESVTIGDNGITSQNVNNRIYLSQGRNIVLRTEAGTDGEVNGMAFVGIYKGTTTKDFGIYGDSYTQGSSISKEVAETFTRNSYVQGKHYTNHNIYVDGFYTNYNEDGKVKIDYIIPTPEDATYYQWLIGEKSSDIYYEDIELIATKYATTATYVLNLNGLSYPNMTINVKGIDVSDLSDTITLNDPDTIANIAPSAEEADSKFGLTMTAGNTGWQTKGTTYFLNNETVHAGFEGRTQYQSDNSTTTPSFSFYMAHSKNISTTAELGTVTIQLEAIYEENEEIKINNVFIVLKLTANNDMQGNDYYEGAITPGREYKIFPTTTTTITSKSSFSTYYSLYVNKYSKTTYYDGFVGHYYHTFESSCVLPEKTKITMIDMSGSKVRYYYYIVSADDVTNNKKVYRFTDFYCMDSTEEHYSSDDSYYNLDTDLLYEEYILHVDFEDTTLTGNLDQENMLVQLRDKYDNTVALTVNTALYPMLFSVYNDIDVNKKLTLTTDKTVIYMGASVDLNIETEYSFNKNENSDIVYETTHIEDQLGVRISISSGSDVLTSADLEGIYITYKGNNYFPRSDGSYRIKIADAVSNVLTNMTLNTENGDLETGTYTITAQSFGSIDGTYFSSEIASDTKNIQVVSTNYGFLVELDEKSVLIDKTNGKNKNDTNNLDFAIGYSGGFESPKIVVSLYRRKYDQVYSYDYQLVDLKDFVTNSLIATSVTKEYLVTDLVKSSQNFTLTTKDSELTTGTYKIVFTLYDGNNKICDMNKFIIIK